MSKIGKAPITIPAGVTATIDGQTVKVKGPKGALEVNVVEEIGVKMEDGAILFALNGETNRHKAMWGLSRTLVANMVQGVTTGFEETLELVGVGYRAAMKGTALSIQLGFSHDVDVEAPAGGTFAVPKQTEIKIAGADKQAVGEIAAKIRRIRPPEPYKGKGVRYAGEKVRRKEGKKK